MNIPYSILKKKNILDKNCYEYHQHLAKYFYILNKNKSSTQNKSNKYSRKKIYKWLLLGISLAILIPWIFISRNVATDKSVFWFYYNNNCYWIQQLYF